MALSFVWFISFAATATTYHHQFFFLSRADLCTLDPLVSSAGSKTQRLICGLISPGIFPKLAGYEIVIEIPGKLRELVE